MSARERRAGEDGHLAGAGPSRLGVVKALRARDVDRPTEEDLAEAERELKVIRTGWTP